MLGKRTTTPSLNVVNEAAKSVPPPLGYAGTDTFAYVLPILAVTIMMRV
jgi:putative transport protein